MDQATIDDSCAQSCAAQKKCSSSVDEATCVNKCKNDAASYVGKVRSDFVSALNSCYATASCDKLAGCADTARASIAPTASMQTFCDELVKKNGECKTGSTDKAKCLENFKMFADVAVETARGTCLTKACTDYGTCVLSTLGIKF